MLEEFGPSLYVADGPAVPFFGIPYPTRMAVARLQDGSTWVWSPVALTPELAQAVDAIGPVRHIVSPNKLHHLFLEEWAERYPDAKLHAPPGLAKKKASISFDTELGDSAPPDWSGEIEQVVFRGSVALEEVVFWHRPSDTALLCDLVQRHDPANFSLLKGTLLRLVGVVGDAGSTPREWKMSFLRRRLARTARESVLNWEPERLLIAHGQCVQRGATEIVSRALAWI